MRPIALHMIIIAKMKNH